MVQYPCSGVGQTKREVFILHADTEEDARFVHEVLLPSLRLPPDSIASSSRLPPGRTIVEAVEQAIATSRVTLLVLSSAFLRESWSSFGEVLASHFAVSGHALLVPLVISDCELPPRLQMWVGLDLRSAHRQHLELARLHELLHAPPAACCAPPAEVPAPRAATPAGTSACARALVQAPPASRPLGVRLSCRRRAGVDPVAEAPLLRCARPGHVPSPRAAAHPVWPRSLRAIRQALDLTRRGRSK